MPAPEHARSDRHGLLGELTRFRQLARVAAEEREIVGALRVIGRLDPQFAFAYYNRGLALARVGKYAGAISDLETYLRLQPNDPDRADIEKMIKELRAK